MVKRIYIYTYEEAKQLTPKSKLPIIGDAIKPNPNKQSPESDMPHSDLDSTAPVTDKDCWMLTWPYFPSVFFSILGCWAWGPMPMILGTSKSYPLVGSWARRTPSASTMVHASCIAAPGPVWIPCQEGWLGRQHFHHLALPAWLAHPCLILLCGGSRSHGILCPVLSFGKVVTGGRPARTGPGPRHLSLHQ